jgi:rare lipoprotein A (RlpA)-like double-psi beta-barrel protein
MAHYVGCHIAPRDRYQPRHAAYRTTDRPPSSGGLIVAVGLTITGILVIGSGIAIRTHSSVGPLATGAAYTAVDTGTAALPPTDVVPAEALPTDALPAVAPAAPPRGTTSAGTCVASWYAGSGTTGPKVATAAHRSLQPGSSVRVTNLANGQSTVVNISGRAPAVARRCLNLSQSAFAAIADLGAGLINVRYETLT